MPYPSGRPYTCYILHIYSRLSRVHPSLAPNSPLLLPLAYTSLSLLGTYSASHHLDPLATATGPPPTPCPLSLVLSHISSSRRSDLLPPDPTVSPIGRFPLLVRTGSVSTIFQPDKFGSGDVQTRPVQTSVTYTYTPFLPRSEPAQSRAGFEPSAQLSMADSSEPQQQSEAVCNFFRKPSKNKNIRKRTSDENDNEDEDSKAENLLVHNKKKPPRPDNKLHFSTGASKRSLSSESNAESSAPIFQFESSKEIQVQDDSRATATLETETDFSRDARAIREKVLKQAEAGLKGKSKNPEGEKLYKGIHGYTDYKAGFRREQTVSSEKAGGSHGPLRASAHIRVSARFDYQPDICKDYKETGYCGYGDSCKFMHDRGDYKSGWQMEKDWEEAEKARKRNLALGGDDMDEGVADQSDEDDEDSLPFACFICRQPFVDPVVTRCKHYFCEHCALRHHAKNKKCFVCNKKTDGIFNAAHEIKKKMAAEGK